MEKNRGGEREGESAPVFPWRHTHADEACLAGSGMQTAGSKAGDAGAVRDLVGAKADVNERDVVQYCQS